MDLLILFLTFFSVFAVFAFLALVCWFKCRRRYARSEMNLNWIDEHEENFEIQRYVLVLDETLQYEHQQNFQGNYFQFSSANNSFSSQNFQLQHYPPSNYYGTLMSNRIEG